MTDSGQGRAHYKALYEQTLKRLEDAEHEAEQWEDSYNELKEELKKTRFVSGMAVKKLAGSCKEAIDGDQKEAEKQIKHLTEKNKELQNDLRGLVSASESTLNGYKEGLEDLKTIAQDKHDSLQTYIKENEKLTKSNRILNASIKRTMKADWKNKFYALEEEATLENQSLKAQIKAMKPASTKTNKEWDVVFKATSKEIAELKEEIAGYEEYQKEVDCMENNLLDLLEMHEVRDSEGHLYTTNDSEVRHYDVLGVVETLLTRLSQTPIMIYKSQE